jgi:hypothetical protein
MNWFIWVVGLAIMALLVWKVAIPFIQKHGTKSFEPPVVDPDRNPKAPEPEWGPREKAWHENALREAREREAQNKDTPVN